MPSPARQSFDPPIGSGGGDAAVIRLDTRRPDRVPPQTATDESEGRDARAELAESVESLFLSHKRTLTDPDTADAFVIAVDAVLHLLAGAATIGVISADQHDELRSMTENLRSAPDGLSPAL